MNCNHKNILAAAITFFILTGPAFASNAQVTIDAQTLNFTPDRNDLSVGEVWFRIQCHKEIAGFPACDNFEVPGGQVSEYFGSLKFYAQKKNEIKIPKVTITFSNRENEFLCIAVRAIFKEVPPENDSDVYLHRGDRYSLVSYCTDGEIGMERPPEGMGGGYPFTQNISRFIEDFNKILATPIGIKTSSKWAPTK